MIGASAVPFAAVEAAGLDDAPFVPSPFVPSERRANVDQPRTRDEARQAYAGLSLVDLLLAGAAATSPAEHEQVAWLALTLHGYPACLHPLTLPSGRRVASLHAHITRWRNFGLSGFTTAETPTSHQLAPP